MRQLTGFGEVVVSLAVNALAERRGFNINPVDTAMKRGFPIALREFRAKAAEGVITGGDGFLTSQPLATTVIGQIPRATLAGEVSFASRPIGSFRARYLITDTAKLTPGIIGEGLAIPVANTSATSITLEPDKIGIIIPYSQELTADPDAVAVVEHDFQMVAQRGGDAAILAATAPDSNSSFSATDDPAADMEMLLGALGDLSGISPPILAASPATLIKISTRRDSGGWLWPEVGLAGGHMLGCPIYPCDALADGVIRAVSGEALALKFGGVAVATSAQASLQLDTDPMMDAGDGTGSTAVSLFQGALIAVKYTIDYTILPLRDTTSAELDGVMNW